MSKPIEKRALRNDSNISYLIDSDYVINWLGGKEPTVSLISSLPMDGFAISIITDGEVFEGILPARDTVRARQSFGIFVGKIRIIPLDLPIMRLFAQLRGELRRQGQSLQELDLLIAATAIENDLMPVTGNTKHFVRTPNKRLFEKSDS